MPEKCLYEYMVKVIIKSSDQNFAYRYFNICIHNDLEPFKRLTHVICPAQLLES